MRIPGNGLLRHGLFFTTGVVRALQEITSVHDPVSRNHLRSGCSNSRGSRLVVRSAKDGSSKQFSNYMKPRSLTVVFFFYNTGCNIADNVPLPDGNVVDNDSDGVSDE